MYRITSLYRQRESFRSTPHSGYDFAMPEGTPLRTIKDGYVENIVDYGNQNAGKTIMIKWEDGKTAIYGHLSKFKPSLKIGDKVKQGDLIGYSGNTGHSTGNHLHFGLKENRHFIDPSAYINDIQNMNVKQYVQHVPEHIVKPTQLKLSFFDYMNQHMNAIGQFKINLINLSNNSLFIQVSKQFLKFVSSHASFFDHIV